MMSDRNQNYTFSIDCIVDLISIDFRFWLMMWVSLSTFLLGYYQTRI